MRNPFSLIGLTETWINYDSHHPFHIDDYEFINKNRQDRIGGGVAFYVLKSFNYTILEEISVCNTFIESLFIEIVVPGNKNIIAGVIYRCPSSNSQEFLQYLSNLLRSINFDNKDFFLMGDFNIDLLDSNSRNAELLKGIYETYGLKQHISKPTRINKSTSKPTLIDHIWETEESNLIKATGTFIALSDHFGQYAKLNLNKPFEQKEKIRFRDFRNYDVNAFNAELQRNIDASPIQEYIETSDINSATETLIKVIQGTAEIHDLM